MKTPFYPQLEERDCGATCLRMVAAHYGLDVSMERLRSVTQTTNAGTSLAGISAGAEELGFETLAAELPYDELVVGDLLPCILHWDRDHFVVATSGSHDGIEVYDPALGPRRLSRDDFEAHRFGPGRSRAGLILRPKLDFASANPRGRTEPSRATQRPMPPAATPPRPPSTTSGPIETKAALMLALTTLFYAGTFAVTAYVIYQALRLAIDLQFHEGILEEIGALLLTSAGLALGLHLLRREAVRLAALRGEADVEALGTQLRRRAEDVRRPLRADLSLQLIEDIDALRVWRGYELAAVHVGVATTGISLVFAFAIDPLWAAMLLLACASSLLLHVLLIRLSIDKVQSAREAQHRQREALAEYVVIAPNIKPLAAADALDQRLDEHNHAATAAFSTIATEIVAQRGTSRFLVFTAAIGLISLALYRLAYGGLQLAELITLLLLAGSALFQIKPVTLAYDRRRSLHAARLRVRELRIEPNGNSTAEPDAEATPARSPERLVLVWTSATGLEQSVAFRRDQHLGLVGFDHETRQAILAGLLGRENGRGARLYFDDDRSHRRDLGQLGALAQLSDERTLIGASIAFNIALTETPDMIRLHHVAELVGLDTSLLEHSLADSTVSQGGLHASAFAKTLLARAIYADAAVILLDGLTDTLDTYDEALLMDRLHQWAVGRLVVTNPKRLNAALGCDLLLQIESTELEAMGTVPELLAAEGAFFYQSVAERNLSR